MGPVVETRTYVEIVDHADGEVMRLHNVGGPEREGLARAGLACDYVACIRPNGAAWVFGAWLLALPRGQRRYRLRSLATPRCEAVS